MSEWEEQLAFQIKAFRLPPPAREFRFHPERKWRFDFAWPDRKVAVEFEGGIWRRGGGAHSHPTNIMRDLEKYNNAALLGWRVLRFSDNTVKSREAIQMIEAALRGSLGSSREK